MRVLVAGGAGYIGSHVVKQLGEAGHEVVTYDNLSTGHRWAVLYGELVEADLADAEKLDRTLVQGFDAVLHFAAHSLVPESVREPLKYYSNNTRNTLELIQGCQRHGIEKFIFSSTAAVYGTPSMIPVSEDTPLAPVSPYGASKMMSERILMDTAAASDLRYVILRYFNVAGADLTARIGEAHEPETHLIPLLLQALSHSEEVFAINGDDYGTPDGTCIRDYIHVEDLARAHIDALHYLSDGGISDVLNCGYGHGYSVREVIEAVEGATGRSLPVRVAGRRPGDVAELVAANDRIKSTLGWRSEYDNLHTIINSAWRWEHKLAKSRRARKSAFNGEPRNLERR